MHRDEDFRRIAHFAQTGTGHLKNGQFVRRAEAILDTAQDSVRSLGVALELQHDIDDVLEDLRSCQRSVFGDVADENDGRACLLGVAQQRRGAFADLRHTARRGIERFAVDGLDGIDNEQCRLDLTCLGQDVLQDSLTQDETVVVAPPKPFGAELDLLGTLLSGDIKRPQILTAEWDLQRERGLSDAGLSADKNHRAGHHPATQNPVEFFDADGEAIIARQVNLPQPLRSCIRSVDIRP